jgi:hypothetical protein
MGKSFLEKPVGELLKALAALPVFLLLAACNHWGGLSPEARPFAFFTARSGGVRLVFRVCPADKGVRPAFPSFRPERAASARRNDECMASPEAHKNPFNSD